MLYFRDHEFDVILVMLAILLVVQAVFMLYAITISDWISAVKHFAYAAGNIVFIWFHMSRTR